jgi:2,3-bisphosphoglycerate-dependent phosphoglycerate mutase
MFRSAYFFAVVILLSSCTTTYYVVRHAEKDAGTTMTATTVKTSDVPLSAEGERRSIALKDLIAGKPVKQLWSTNTIRSKATIEPYSKQIGKNILLYSNDSLDQYILKWKEINSGSILIAGHSNTVDDIVNGLKGEKVIEDLPDNKYGDLFIVRKKKRVFKTATFFERKRFGQ